MKKNDMEDIITAAIDSNGRFNEQVSTEELATIILYEIEKAGMIPPTTFGYGAFPINKWEDEE